jgi:hypothetical protein
MGLAIPLALAAVSSGGASLPATVDVTLVPPAAHPGPAVATLVVTSGDLREEVTVPLPGEWRLTVVAGRAVTIEARAEGLWAAPVVVLPPAHAEIRFAAAGRVIGKASAARPGPAPGALKLRFSSQTGQGLSGEAACAVADDGGVSWWLPVGVFDLQLSAEGFVSVYFWDRTVATGTDTDLGAIRLVPGNSLTGWLRTEDGKPLARSAAVVLRPAGAELPEAARKGLRLDALDLAKRPDGTGFFHFAGVAPGTYDLLAHQDGYVDAVRHGVAVHDGLEARVSGDVVLTTPRTAAVEVTPPRPFGSERWLVTLLRQSRDSTVQTAEQVTDDGGVASFSGLAPGPYIALVSSGGKRWAKQAFEVTDSDERIRIDTGSLHVLGRVLLGKEPLAAAAVIFGGRTGEVSVEMRTDDAGALDGYLPRGGDWKVEISAERPVVERSLGKITVSRRPRRDFAEVEIRLPDSRVQGTVVDEAGVPPRRAIVRLRPRVTDEGEIVADASGGVFDVRGIPAGLLEVQAESRDGVSDTVLATVMEEGITGPLELVLRSLRPVGGTVAGPRGGAPGVRVYLRPVGEGFHGGDEVFTDARGEFTARLPRSVRGVAVQLMAPGYALTLLRTPLPEQGRLAFRLSEAAGAVALRLPPGLEDAVFGVHAGCAAWYGALWGWAQMNPAERSFDATRNELVLPRLEPGEWSFCVAVPGSAEWFSIWALGVPPPGPCRTVTVQPGTTVAVDLAASRESGLAP